MLMDREVATVLPASDLSRARQFYHDKLGLDPVVDDVTGDLRYRLPHGEFEIYETPNAGTARNTAMCWITPDLMADMEELRMKGVMFEEYDQPGLKTKDGVADMGGEMAAWFKDSEGNILCLTQMG